MGTQKLSEEFSWTESPFLGALSKRDELLLNLQVWTCFIAVPRTSRNNDSENRESTGNRSLGDPSPKAVFHAYHSSNPIDSVQDEIQHMVTGVQEKIRYCSPGTSSGKQKKACYKSATFRSENTPATTIPDQSLLAPQQLAAKSNSANFIDNVSRISKLPKSLATSMSTSAGNQRNLNCLKINSKPV